MEAPAPSLAHTLLWGFARVFSILALVVAWEGLAREFRPFSSVGEWSIGRFLAVLAAF